MNNNFADIINNTIQFAPSVINIGRHMIFSPSENDYAKAGYWTVVESHPSPVEGKHEVEQTPQKIGEEKTREETITIPLTDEEQEENDRRMNEWENNGCQNDPPELIEPRTKTETVKYTVYKIYRTWKLEDDVIIPRKWSRLSLKTAIANNGWMSQMKQILNNIEVAEDYTAWEALTDCNYIEEFWPSKEKWNEILNYVSESIGKTRNEIDGFIDTIPEEI